MRYYTAILAALVVGVLVACSHRAANHRSENASPVRDTGLVAMPIPYSAGCPPECEGRQVLPIVLSRSRYGVTCLGDVAPGETPNPAPRPEVFLARDIGKPGFPELSSAEIGQVERIRKHVRSATLSIAWAEAEFVVFDAVRGPCDPAPYTVLNSVRPDSEVYEPGETPYHTIPQPGA
jgi:hypothetical protein